MDRPPEPARSPVRIAVVTDIHYGPTPAGETKLGMRALELLDDVLGEIASYAPDLLVEMGDRVSDVSADADAARLRELAERFARLDGRREHLMGNHDIVNLTDATTSAVLGAPVGHRSVELHGWHLVFWDASPEYRGGLRISDEDLAWFEAALGSSEAPTVVFSHVPLGDGSMHGNYYFESRPEGRAAHANADAARAIVEAAGNVVLAVAGHVHWNSLNTVDGTHYVTVQSLTESFTTPPDPAGAWAAVELGEELRVRVHGRDPFEVVLAPKAIGSHWTTPKHRRRAMGDPLASSTG
jgi:3',5'-cyclic-AMP phosphodiesterase